MLFFGVVAVGVDDCNDDEVHQGFYRIAPVINYVA